MTRLFFQNIGIICAYLIFIPLFSFSAYAQETIKNFDASLSVYPDGHVNIEEKINVTVEHAQINHGIYRDIPTEYTDRMGNRVRIRFSLLSIQRDGVRKPYHIKTMSNGLRIYIGDKDTLVPRGEHTYTLLYSVSRVIGFFETYDELYWNVTGNGWNFPIDHTKVQINFPDEASIQNYAGYTGPQGAQYKNYRASSHGNYLVAETTKRLNPYEGFTVAASIPKLIIHPETGFQKKIAFLKDNIAWLMYGVSSLGLFLFLFFAWFQWGRDVPGTIFPRFELLKGLRPDFLRYVYRQDYDIGAFTILFIDAAVKGYIKITDTKTSVQIGWQNLFDPKSSTHQTVQILKTLFGVGGGILLPKKTFFGSTSFTEEKRREIAVALQRAKIEHAKYLSGFGINYFTKNWGIRIIGVAIIALSLLSGYFLSWNKDQQVMVLIATSITQICISLIFYKPLNKYTDNGQRLRDYADGLKLYLTTAEQARLNKLYPKTITPEKFEEFLPYAFALDVEQEWCQRFERLIRSGHATYNTDRSPSWYRGVNNQSFALSALSSSLGSSLQSTISSASTPPGSKSGSLGGGSSGGGGGGGGGGGW